MVPYGTLSMANRVTKPQVDESNGETSARARILEAAFAAFTERGYAQTSTLEIATRAGVSKRDLYTLVGNKQQILASCIQQRAKRLQLPAHLPEPRDRETFAELLVSFGTQLLRETTDSTVIAVFRLAIAEAVHTPEVAQALHKQARTGARDALIQVMARAESAGLMRGSPADMAVQFAALLWGDVLLELLLGLSEPPDPRELVRRARTATTALFQLYPAADTTEPTRTRKPTRKR
jgi:AcrR family transcriptional regulator